MGKVGSSPAFRRNNRQNPHPPKEPTEFDNGVLTDEELDALEACATGEEVAKLLSHEAMQTIIQIMRRPGRHAQTQLAAARELIAYGVSKPAQATTLSGPDGGAVQVTHRLEFVEPEKA